MTLTNFLADGNNLWSALALTLGFSILARVLRGVSLSGAIAGGVVCFLLVASAGWGAFIALVAVFLLTWIATRVGYHKKQQRGTAERRQGRTASQVLANLAVATICAGLFAIYHTPALLVAACAALCEAAADTVSSEIGQALSGTARLISTWRQVPAGTDGGITVGGTLGGLTAAILVSIVCGLTHLVPWRLAWIPIAAGMAGMFLDSLLGAGLERRKWLNNDAVNFLGTLSAASLTFLLV